MDRGGEVVIGFTLQQEPDTFDERCRKRGQAWLTNNPTYKRPNDYWTEFEPDLREAFGGLCAYCAMKIMKGQVDHFRPVAVLKKEGNDELAYEWSNFRYGEGVLNGKKWKHVVLDPFVVQDGWFEIQLPSLQLRMTDAIPQQHRDLAAFTIKRLGLRDSEVVVRYRQEWFRMYRDGKLTLDGLRDVAPLIAQAVQKDLDAGNDWRNQGGRS
jgi:hypothetical protein